MVSSVTAGLGLGCVDGEYVWKTSDLPGVVCPLFEDFTDCDDILFVVFPRSKLRTSLLRLSGEDTKLRVEDVIPVFEGLQLSK